MRASEERAAKSNRSCLRDGHESGRSATIIEAGQFRARRGGTLVILLHRQAATKLDG